MGRTIKLIAVAALLSGCASNPNIELLSSDDRGRLSEIEIFEGKPERQFEIVGPVTGLSCHRNANIAGDVSRDEAMEGIRIMAVQLKADAVINLACQKKSGTDWSNNCWASVKCLGDAIRYQ